MKGNDVDDQSTPIGKLPQAHECSQLLTTFAMKNSVEFSIVVVTNM
jgi:hypothetical protein